MQPGRELDALIAEKVMGWTKNTTLDYIPIYYPPGPPEMNIVGHIISEYSTDIAAAWKVVEQFKTKYDIELSCENQIWELYMENEDMDPSHISAKADTAPHAICLAALKALGAEIK